MEVDTETRNNRHTSGNNQRMFDFSVSDFATVLTLTSFVDKTAMLQDVFNSPATILLTAPRRFGKSTNLDMMKRFLEIEADASGTPRPVHTTENYRLFKDNNLQICRNDSFFNEHFGKHPVIYLNCEPLGVARDFENMLDIFRTITIETFSLHRYLLNVNNLWTEDLDVEDLKKYSVERLIVNTNESDLVRGFKYLCKVLYRHFGKKVFVLIDDYDAFVNSPMLKNNTRDTEKMVSFIKITMDDLLKKNRCVERAVVTGVLPGTGEGFPFHENNINSYYFMESHPFCKYYGLTSEELDKILVKLIRDDEEIKGMRRTIDFYYKGYVTVKHNGQLQVYSIWSVFQYIYRRELQSYWCCFEHFKQFLHHWEVRSKLEQLLLGNTLQMDVTQKLSVMDIIQLNDVIRRDTVRNLSSSVVDTFFVLLYHLGYLSVSDTFGRGLISLKIPTDEIKYELAKAVLQANLTFYSFNQKYADDFRAAIDLFRPDSPDHDETFITFRKTILNLCGNVPSSVIDSHDFQTRLFMILVTKPEYSRTVTSQIGVTGPTVILLKNRHEVAVCITAQRDTSDTITNETLIKCAENAHKKVIDNYPRIPAFRDSGIGVHIKVLIGIGYGAGVGYVGVGTVYSYYFKEGDSLRDYRTLTDFDFKA